MVARLWSFLLGYVSLVIEGNGLEKLINMAVGRGLFIWDVKWLAPGRASLKIRLSGVKALRHIAKRTNCRFKVTARTGMPFYFYSLKKRKALLVGAVLSIALVYAMSSFIWFVEVKGNKNIVSPRIIQAASDAGLAMGTLKFGMDKDGIEKYIRNEIPEVSWVGVTIRGTRAVIEVAEKVIAPPVDDSPANVVAAKDGLIEELLVLAGKGVAAEGSMVKQGDVLITGVIMPEPKPEEESSAEKPQETVPAEPVKFVRARGIVRARVWYEGYGECRIVDQGLKRSGRLNQTQSIILFGKEFIIKGAIHPSYHNFEMSSEVKTLPGWRNLQVPVELVKTNYYELVKYRDIIGISEAKALARGKAIKAIKANLPAGARIASELATEMATRDNNIVRVKAVIEAIEQIGKVEPLKP